jgi:Na+/melibiose symporter-like transporter
MERTCLVVVFRIAALAAILCSVLLYYLGLQWVQQDERHIAVIFVAGVALCLGVVVAYGLRERLVHSPPKRVSSRVLLLLAMGAAACMYSILYMQTAGLYWQPRIAGALAFLVYAIAGYVVWYRPYKLTVVEDRF